MESRSSFARRLLEAGQWAPPALLCWLLAGFSLEQPIFDQWALSAFFEKVATGSAGLEDLFAYHNRVHIIALLKLIQTPLAFATDWSLKAEAFLNLALVALTFCVLRWISAQGVPEAARHRLIVPNLLTSLLLFSPVHYFDWFYSFALCIFLVNGSIVAAAFVLSRRGGQLERRDFWLAAIFCTAATLSRLDGLLSWLCMLPCLLQRIPDSSRKLEYSVAWSAMTLVCWVAVLSGIDATGLGQSPVRSLFENPVGAFVHVLALLGIPLFHFVHAIFPTLSVGVAWGPGGLLTVLLFAYLAASCLRGSSADLRARAAPWVAIGLYPILYAGMNAAGRLDKGDALFELGSMYAGATVLLVIAVVQLGTICMGVGRARTEAVVSRGVLRGSPSRFAVAGLASLLAINYAVEVPQLVAERRASHTRRVCGELALYLDEESTCEVKPRGMERLERLGFRELARDIRFVPRPPEPLGGIDDIRPAARRTGSPAWQVSGWVSPPEASGSLDVLISLGDRERFAGHASRYAEEGEARVRWYAELPEELVRSGGSPVRAWLYQRDRAQVVQLGEPVKLR